MAFAWRRDVPHTFELRPRHRRKVKAPRIIIVVLPIRTAKNIQALLVYDGRVSCTPRWTACRRLHMLPYRRVFERVEIKAPQLIIVLIVDLSTVHEQIRANDRKRMSVAPNRSWRSLHARRKNACPLPVVQVQQV